MIVFKLLIHLLIIVLLTALTQIGGVIWILVFAFFGLSKKDKTKKYRLFSFTIIYLGCCLLIVPQLSKLNGRVSLPKVGNLSPHNYMTVLMNRHYVEPKLKEILIESAHDFNAKNSNLKIKYLDANFPFINGFPLLPHLSHDDGKKVDISFQYLKDGIPSNQKPSRSGYGIFVNPKKNQSNQTSACKQLGYWQYDVTKYFSLGNRDGFSFDETRTKQIIEILLSQPRAQKLLLEPHLKERLNLSNSKIRFQGCHSVRHDDHIHFQIQ